MPPKRVCALAIALCCAVLAACASPTGIVPRGLDAASMPIDLQRFMGEWYVIAHIPTSPEADAYEAVERYSLREDGGIDVAYRFCEGGVDGPLREIPQQAWVFDPRTNAEWRVRPVWPLRLAYQIRELEPDYQTTVVTNPGGYAWVMARSPRLPESQLGEIEDRLARDGFDTSLLRRVPHEDGLCDGRTPSD